MPGGVPGEYVDGPAAAVGQHRAEPGAHDLEYGGIAVLRGAGAGAIRGVLVVVTGAGAAVCADAARALPHAVAIRATTPSNAPTPSALHLFSRRVCPLPDRTMTDDKKVIMLFAPKGCRPLIRGTHATGLPALYIRPDALTHQRRVRRPRLIWLTRRRRASRVTATAVTGSSPPAFAWPRGSCRAHRYRRRRTR